MQIVNFSFLIFLFISVIVYYAFSKKNRWFVLLVSSILFFLFASSWKLLLYLIFTIITTFLGTNLMGKYSKKRKLKKRYQPRK